MNCALVLAGGVGQRMRSSGLPKQFLKLLGKPIIIYTLEKFELCKEIERVVVSCNSAWIDYMNEILQQFHIKKVVSVVAGGMERQNSIINGLKELEKLGDKNDIVLIHDGVRPLVSQVTIMENIRIAEKYGNAMTVKTVTESVVVTSDEIASISDFQRRDNTYSLTSPQSFRVGELLEAYDKILKVSDSDLPLIDASLVYAQLGKKVYMVKEQESNIKITTPEDFYYFKSILELEENKYIFGL